MIRYVGGKTRHAEAINQVLMANSNGCTAYYEPFFGGGSMAKHTWKMGLVRMASDSNKHLINLFQAIQGGWLPPERVSEYDYGQAMHCCPCPLSTYIGFACSYGGKWFGGFARDATGRRDLSYESYLRVCRDAPYLTGIHFEHRDYNDLALSRGDLVYCDPPYAATLGYGQGFDHVHFWDSVRRWSMAGATVLVSEYAAPADFESIWAKGTSVSIHNQSTGNRKIEHLFRHRERVE